MTAETKTPATFQEFKAEVVRLAKSGKTTSAIAQWAAGLGYSSTAVRAIVLGLKSKAAKPTQTAARCIYCEGPVRKGSLSIDGEYAHHRCHADALKQ